ncbi:MAG: GNAT family N-acetyltransferase [Candidatus Hodarchaeales archaeon]
MIKRITSKELDLLDSTISAYLRYINEKLNRPKFPLKVRLAERLKQNSIEIYGKFFDDEVIGFVIIYLNDIGMNIILNKYLIDEMKLTMVELDLFDEAFSRMKKEFQSMRYMGQVSEPLARHLRKNEFLSFRRARMRIIRESIQSLPKPKLPDGYEFREYRLEDKERIIEIMAQSHFNENHPDGLIWKNWNGITGCRDLLNGIESSQYGKFNTHLSKVIEKDGKPIAVCLVTLLANEVGYIPEIVVSNTEKKKGLGKQIMAFSLKEFIKNEQSSSKIELDVTLDNSNASKLYTSLGFTETNQYTVYVWNERNIEY